MDPRVEHRVVQLLRDGASPAIGLRHLHLALAAEAGPVVGSYARFAEDLRRRSEVFVVLEPDDPLAGVAAWPPELRDAYEIELDAAGMRTGPQVALARRPVEAGRDRAPPDRLGGGDATDSPPPTLRHVHDSLMAFIEASRDRPRLQQVLALAIGEFEALRRALEEGDGP